MSVTAREYDPDEPFGRLSPDEVWSMIGDGGVQLVDIRRPGEYAAGHLPGSVLIPLDQLMTRSGELSAEAPIVFVCAVGLKSQFAAEIAATAGRTQLYNLEGGIAVWQERGFPLET